MSIKRAMFMSVMFGIFCAIYIGVGILAVGAFQIWDFGNGVLWTCGFDVVFFVSLYIISDIFGEVLGYTATRLTGVVSAAMSIVVFGSLYLVNLLFPPEVTTMEGVAGGTSIWGWLPATTLIMTVGGSVIFSLGDWVNDIVHQILHTKHYQNKQTGYRKYISRTIGSSIAGRTFDAFVFSTFVASPLMLFGFIDWGWGEPYSRSFWATLLIGNVLLQVVLQVLIELATSFPTYKLTVWVKQKLIEFDCEAGLDISEGHFTDIKQG